MIINQQKPDKKPLNRLIFLCFILSLLQACSNILERPASTESTETGAAYLGVLFNPAESAQGLKIQRLLPGPLQQVLSTNLNINIEQDHLSHINGQPVTAENFKRRIAEYHPGQTITLDFQQTGQDSEEISTQSVDVTLGSTARWTGPIAKSHLPQSTDERKHHSITSSKENPLTEFIQHKTSQAGLSDEVNKLYSLFSDWQKNNIGFHSLSRVNHPFQEPEQLLELEQTISKPLANLHNRPGDIFTEFAKNLDLQVPPTHECKKTTHEWRALEETITRADQFLVEAFEKINPANINNTDDGLAYLLSELSNLRTLDIQSSPLRSLDAMNASMQIDFNALLRSASTFQCFIHKDLTLILPESDSMGNIPFELTDAITGKIRKAIKIGERWLVYGGDKNNHYDMSKIDIVYDSAGNDTYQFSKPEPISLKLVIDKSGNDSYQSKDFGPATGWLGTSLLIDQQGHDRYTGNIAANGTGMMGIGVLIDYAGRDEYKGNHFSNGAAFYGAGALIDMGTEGDIHQSSTFSQGFGGPRGVGLLFDYQGNDLYRANGSTPSVYGTPAVYVSFSQGIGFGLRHYDSGGIGVLYDANGADRYEGGEFSQAGGYYWGLGILHDENGDDLYYGNRYSQGFAAHQATGILVDKKGNDNYWGMTAACQGAAWDVAMGLLFDTEGDDTYRGDDLCQGAAAMQAMGWLIDLDGTDHYTANSQSAQGHSGNNTYHYNAEHPVYSWSLLFDAGGNEDFFSNTPYNNQSIRYSDINIENKAESLIHGLFIDHDEKLN